MKRDILTYRTASIISLGIALLMHAFFLIFFVFGRSVFLAENSHMPPDRPEPTFEPFRMAISFVSVFIFCFLLYVLNFKILEREIKRYRVLIIILASVTACVILTLLLTHLQMYLVDFKHTDHYGRILMGGMMKDMFLTLVVIFTSQILYLSYKKQQIALENERLQAENIQSRYETLKNQVDPHFLFNTLNTLNSMIKLDPDKAQEYVQKMSSVFRYTLQNKQEISLEEELNFTRDYCLLMQIRYGESLEFKFDIDPKYNLYHIIPLSVQTLVENAIKHNVITKRQPLTVTIATGDDATLSVSNPLQEKKESESGEGIGLANLTERYHLRFQRDIELSCNDNVFRVTIPLILPQKQSVAPPQQQKSFLDCC